MIGTKRRKEYLDRLSKEHPQLAEICKKELSEWNIIFDSYSELLRTAKDWAEVKHNLEKQDA